MNGLGIHPSLILLCYGILISMFRHEPLVLSIWIDEAPDKVLGQCRHSPTAGSFMEETYLGFDEVPAKAPEEVRDEISG